MNDVVQALNLFSLQTLQMNRYWSQASPTSPHPLSAQDLQEDVG